MKTRLFLLSLSCSLTLSAQVTFPVCNVKPADEAIEEISYRNTVGFLAEKNPYNQDWTQDTTVLPEPHLEAYGRQTYGLVATNGNHPFVVAAHQAYAQHRPLVLSPDMIWLLILQGFAAHVDANGEQLRHYFVQHDGRKVLCIQRDDYVRGDSLFPWPEVFTEFRQQIAAHTSKELVPLVSAEFSTTGLAERAAFEVTLMDAMSSYFLYAMQVVCGIPEITLEGTPEDWAELERRTAELGKYDLSWWTDELQPILHEFTLASQGQVNRDFWRDYFQYETVADGCTSVSFVTGWILKFFPYYYKKPNPWVTEPDSAANFYAVLEDAMSLRNDPAVQRVMNKEGKRDKLWRRKYALSLKMHPHPQRFGLPAIEISDLPMGLSKADLLLDYHGARLAYELQAGFIGIRQDAETLALRPEINWLVVDTGKAPTAEDNALYDKWLEGQKSRVGRE